MGSASVLRSYPFLLKSFKSALYIFWKEKCHWNVTQPSLRKGFPCTRQLRPCAHLADIISIDLSLDELGQVGRQAVLVDRLFSLRFVGDLKGKNNVHAQMNSEVGKRLSWHRKRIPERITLLFRAGAFHERLSVLSPYSPANICRHSRSQMPSHRVLSLCRVNLDKGPLGCMH